MHAMKEKIERENGKTRDNGTNTFSDLRNSDTSMDIFK
jgi:hypothetical protein